MTVMTSRVFNQDTGRAKKAAKEGPVFITDRGRTSLVLLSIEEYQRLTSSGKSLLETVAPKEPFDFDLELTQSDDLGFKPVDFD